MKKIFATLLLCAGVGLSNAGWAETATSLQQNGMVYCVHGSPTSFNPQLASSGLTVDTLSSQLYDRLLDVDPYTYRLLPSLAANWRISDKGATYRFHLRHNVWFQKTANFTPSRPMNADDVVFSFQRMLVTHHPWHQVSGGRYPYFDSLQFSNSVASIKKLDTYTVEFRLTHPDAAFPWHLATHYAPILSAEYADKLTALAKPELLDQHPVGTGPFILQEYRSGEYIRLKRNQDYWRETVRLNEVVVDIGAGATGRLSKLITGECDVLAYPAASQLTVLRDDPRLRMTLRPGMNIAYLAFNTQQPPLNNPRVRHALALAINNQQLMASIYYGTAETAASILPRASWAYDNQSQVTAYDPPRAIQQLAELGIHQLSLRLAVPVASEPWNPSPLKTAELIQADLSRIGVEVKIIPIEGYFHHSALETTDHELTLAGWSTDSFDPDSFLRPILSCAANTSGTNYAHWCNHDFDQGLYQALLSQQLSGRIDLYRNSQQILAKELPILPLASSLRLQAYRQEIRGLVLSPFGSSSFAGVYREPKQ